MTFQRALSAVALLGLAACPTFTNLKTARAIDQGEFQLTVAPEIIGAAIPAGNGTGSTNFTLPQIEVAGRYGISDGFDIGARLWIAGLELDSTISLLRGGFDLALAPGVGFFGIGGSSTASTNGSTSSSTASIMEVPIYIPLLAGLNFGAGHQFVFGAEAIPTIVLLGSSSGASSSSGSAFELFAGGTAGVSFRVTPTFRIMPEVNVFVPVVTAATSNGNSASALGSSGGIIYQFALGFSFGNDGFKRYGQPALPAAM